MLHSELSSNFEGYLIFIICCSCTYHLKCECGGGWWCTGVTLWARVAYLVQQLTKWWTVEGSSTVRGKMFYMRPIVTLNTYTSLPSWWVVGWTMAFLPLQVSLSWGTILTCLKIEGKYKTLYQNQTFTWTQRQAYGEIHSFLSLRLYALLKLYVAHLKHNFVHKQICVYPCLSVVRILFLLHHSSVNGSYLSMHLHYIDSIAKPAWGR